MTTEFDRRPDYLRDFYRVHPRYPRNSDTRSLRDFLREVFGDHDIYTRYEDRRWVTYEGDVFFRDEEDVVIFGLGW